MGEKRTTPSKTDPIHRKIFLKGTSTFDQPYVYCCGKLFLTSEFPNIDTASLVQKTCYKQMVLGRSAHL